MMKTNTACTSRNSHHHPAETGRLIANVHQNLVLLVAFPAIEGEAQHRELPIVAWRAIHGPLPPGFPPLEPVTPWLTPISYLDSVIYDIDREYGENSETEFQGKAQAIAYLTARSLEQAESDSRADG